MPIAYREIKTKGTALRYKDWSNVWHNVTGVLTGLTGLRGRLKVKDIRVRNVDYDGDERQLSGLLTGDAKQRGVINIKGDNFYFGDIVDLERYILMGGISANIDSINYTTWDVFHQTVKVYDDLCVCVWEGPNLPVKMSSYSIDSEGNMSNFLTTHNIYIGDDYAYPTGSILVGDGIVATLFTGWHPYWVVLKTHKVEIDGSISHIDTWIVTDWPDDTESNGGSICDIIHVASTTYAILVRGGEDNDYLILRTVLINTDGTFPETIPDEIVKYGKDPTKSSLISMGDGVFVVARETRVGSNQYGLELNAFTINDAGGITTGDSKTICAAMERNFHDMCLVSVNSSVLAILYYRNIWETSTPSFTMKTIAMTGANFGAVLDTEELLPLGADPHIISVSGDIFLYAYRASPNKMRTVTISSTGIIGDTVDERSPMGGYGSYLMHVLGEIYTINYSSTLSVYGYIISFSVS